MTDKDVLEELLSLFGGTIHDGLTYKAHHKQVWVWRVSGKTAANAMKEISPYMFSRRAEKINTVLLIWQERQNHLKNQRNLADKAAKAWLSKEGSLRSLSQKYGVGYETIRRHAKNLVT